MLLNRFVGVAVGAAVVSSASAGLLTMDIYGGLEGETVVVDNGAWDLNPSVNQIQVNTDMLLNKYVELVAGSSLSASSTQGAPGTLGQVTEHVQFQASGNLPRVGIVGQYQETMFEVYTYQTDFSMVNTPLTISSGVAGDFHSVQIGGGMLYGGGLNPGNVGHDYAKGEGDVSDTLSDADPANFHWYSAWNRNLSDPFAITTVTWADMLNFSYEHAEVTTSASVPEPASMAALGLGLAAALRRRKRN